MHGGLGGPGGMNNSSPNGNFGGGNSGFSGGGMRSGPMLGPPGRWWDDKKVSHSLNIRSDQQKRMDDIFTANRSQLVSAYNNLQREEQKLGSMSTPDLQDESKVFAAIDRVAQARADLEKLNAHILVQIRHELDGEQLVKLDKELR
ncbi:hypothetical protein ACFQBQ_14785 [Granulicella cerasi]|uniref:Periplasmic heavy metal sensor n=2 Tax=Granulicella cerasi TaxID=741063 RepID=A0ABW1ZF73_9BACT